MRGITSWGAYLPHWRLDRTTIASVAGQGGGRGTRTVAGFDQDTTTLAVEAARLATADAPTCDQVLFATVAPAYADKTNATTLHAALGLPDSTAAFDLGASSRSAMGALLLAAGSVATSLVAVADIRTGRAGSSEESSGGDAGAAVVVASSDVAPVAAEIIATASATVEAVDRWRAPGQQTSRTWDERFTEVAYRPAVERAFADALVSAGLTAADVDVAVIAAPSARVGAAMARRLGVARVADDLAVLQGACPVVASYGGADRPFRGSAQRLERALDDAGVPHDVEEYPGAQHGFVNRMTAASRRDAQHGSSPRPRPGR